MKTVEFVNHHIVQFIDTYLMELTVWTSGFRILLAALIGGIIGFNRARHGRAAGLRTHMLVCIGSAITVMTGLFVNGNLGFSGDPMRVGAQVISGIGFLGAGTIMNRNGSQVIGLTTAAGLWATASLGLAIGCGYYSAAVFGFLALIATMSILCYLEAPLEARGHQYYYLEVTEIEKVSLLLDSLGEGVQTVEIQPARSGLQGHIGVVCAFSYKVKRAAILAQTRDCEYVCLAIPEEWREKDDGRRSGLRTGCS